MYPSRPPPKTSQRKAHLGLKANNLQDSLLQELNSDSEDSEDEAEASQGSSSLPDDRTARPWMAEFHDYLQSDEKIPDNVSAIQWWGVSILA